MTKRKVITIEVTDEEVDALKCIFFVKLSEEQREKLQDAKHSLWKKIATAFDSDAKGGLRAREVRRPTE